MYLNKISLYLISLNNLEIRFLGFHLLSDIKKMILKYYEI